MNRRISISVALAITLIAMTVTFAITWILSMNTFDSTVSAVTRLQSQYAKLAEIDTYVRGNYYGDINEDVLFDRVATGYMAGLSDRYSVYYSEAEYSEMMAIENGTLVGVGLEILRDADGSTRIMRVYPDSPAARAGVQPHGRITAINGEDIKNFSSTKAVLSALRGAQGTDLALKCLYGVDEQSFEIRRSNYTAPTVESQMVAGYAYIRIYSFTASTFTDFDYEVRQAVNAEAKGIIFDLRGNSSGQFRHVYDIIDILCPRGTVAKAEYKNGTTRVLATSDENFVDLPMVALVNAETSAAAELFAVSIRDLAGGQIVGARTLGKGTMQGTPQRLSDGSAVVVTVAKLLTGSDESFDGVGLSPNIETEPIEDEGLLYTPNPDADGQIRRSLEVLRAMVRERGGDPGPAIPAAEADASQTTPQGTSLPGDSSETGSSTGEDSSADASDASGTSGTDDDSSAASSSTGEEDSSTTG